MPVINDFAEAHEVLRAFYGPTGADGPYTLERMRTLMDLLDNPQDSLKVLHVAGTSGKTSTAYYASALLETSGANVGLTVSPHVDEVNERVQINRTPLPEKIFCKSLGEFIEIVKTSGIRPSYFELMMAFAFHEFARQKADYAVIEVGLGGLLDATNVISRKDKVCIITDIGLDHTEILGDTLAKIAAQKAGIIQPENRVFMYEQTAEVMQVVREVCEKQNADLHEIAPAKIAAPENLPLFQQRNLYLAEQAVNYILARDKKTKLAQEQIKIAAKTRVPARMEIFRIRNKTLIIDGSHNGQKLGALAESIRAKFPGKSVAVLAAFVEGEPERWQQGADALIALADSLILTSFKSEQDVPKSSVNPEIVAKYCREKGFENVQIEQTPKLALQKLLAQPEQILLVTGSFYLLNHIRPLLI